VDRTEESSAILSICTGIRGLERGVERAGANIRVVAYVEIEAFICFNLVAAMESGLLAPAPIWTDLKTFPFEQFRGKIHGIIGGYPCQPFSVAGDRNGESDPRHLWPFIKCGIEAVKPIWCFFENVPGHLSLGYQAVREDLQQLGYRVEEGIFSAEEVGAPHQRKRLFILAILGNTNFNRMRRRPSHSQTGEEGSNQIETSGRELANTNRAEPGRKFGKILDPAGETEGETSREHGEWLRSESGDSSKSISYTNSEGLERREEQSTWEQQAIERSCGQNRFPASPGTEQYEWEEPRTTEPGVGCTAHGYNFREDLLRALGNGVVEQTAELAFKTLLKKLI
jgi:DNA (cytosine-5)-methyltransferase 1